MGRTLYFGFALLLIIAIPGGMSATGGDELLNFSLRDVAAEAGVRGEPSFGRAVAWGDYDQDGQLDLFVCKSMGHNPLYRNNGDGTFTDVSAEVGLPQQPETVFGAIWVDYDNDGDQDLHLAIGAEILEDNAKPAEDRLLRNDVNTSGRFTDVTAIAHAGGGRTRSWGAAWADYDNDGFLDVYISNTRDACVLLHNRGDGTFEDVSVRARVNSRGTGRFCLWLDYDVDGWMDIFQVNVKGLERLYRNNHDGTFTDMAVEAGITEIAPFSWVASAEDFNHDGLPDLALASWNNPNTSGPLTLFLNKGDGTFAEQASSAGIAVVLRSMSIQTGDLNNDGHMDMILGNGGPSGPDPNSLFLNAFDARTGDLRFLDVSDTSGLTNVPPGRNHGIGFADVDSDGDLDVYISEGGPASDPESKDPNVFFINDGGNANQWIRLRLEGTRSNRDAVGARVKVVSGNLSQYLYVKGGSGFGSTNEPFVHAGLGSAAQADRIEITWPSGTVQTLYNIPAGSSLRVTEPGPAPHWRPPSRATSFELRNAAETAERPGRFTLTCACCGFETK